MGSIRDWDRFKAGRWDWTSLGYEHGFPRRCQFSDVDAVTEFDGRILMIESKYNDGVDAPSYPDVGQVRLLRRFRKMFGDDGDVFIVYGDAEADEPWALRILGMERSQDLFEDWRTTPNAETRRERFKAWIDWSLGIEKPN